MSQRLLRWFVFHRRRWGLYRLSCWGKWKRLSTKTRVLSRHDWVTILYYRGLRWALFAPTLPFCCLHSGFVVLTQSIQSRRLINSALRQSSYLQSPIALHSNQKVQVIQLTTDGILIASSRELNYTNHNTYIARTLHSWDNTWLQLIQTQRFILWHSGTNILPAETLWFPIVLGV